MKLTIKKLLARQLGLLSPDEHNKAEKLLKEDPAASKTDKELEKTLKGNNIPIPKRLHTLGDTIWENKQKPNQNILPFRKPRQMKITLAAAASILLIAGLLLFFSDKKTTMTNFAHKKGRITIEGKAADTAKGISPGQTLQAAANSYAKLQLPREGVLKFNGPGSLTLIICRKTSKKPQQRWFLKKGRLSIALHPGSYTDFRITTPHLSLRVTGTSFSVHTDETSTRVNVSQGQVIIKEKDKPEKTVSKGEDFQSSEIKSNTQINNEKNTSNGTPHKKTSVNPTIITNSLYKTGSSSKPIQKTRTSIREKILLNNGSSLTGRIIKQNAGIITIKTSAGTLNIPRKDVKSIRIIKTGETP